MSQVLCYPGNADHRFGRVKYPEAEQYELSCIGTHESCPSDSDHTEDGVIKEQSKVEGAHLGTEQVAKPAESETKR